MLLCLLAFAVLSMNSQAQAPDKDKSAALKKLLRERHAMLEQALTLFTAQYKTGKVNFGRVARAEQELLKATLALAENPEQRLAALRSLQEKAEHLTKIAEALSKAGMTTQVDVLEARAAWLAARIALLQEELKDKGSK